MHSDRCFIFVFLWCSLLYLSRSETDSTPSCLSKIDEDHLAHKVYRETGDAFLHKCFSIFVICPLVLDSVSSDSACNVDAIWF